MEGKLVKEYGDFYLISDKEIESGDEYVKLDNRPRTLLLGTTIASAKVPKLSLENCISIEKGYDIEELAKKSAHTQALFNDLACYETGFIRGFLACVEIFGDKKFTYNQMVSAITESSISHRLPSLIIQDLQQTEWDCIIEMEYDESCCKDKCQNPELDICDDGCAMATLVPKLDADGNLILKRKS